MDPSILFEKDEDVFGKVAQIYERTEDSLGEDVNTLKDWMKTQPHLPEIMDGDMIRNFLILNKCSVERTKQRIDMYYTIRSLIPDIFDIVNPKRPNIQLMTQIGAWVTLPRLTKEMYRVVWFKMLDESLIDQMEPFNVVGLLLNLYEIRLKEDLIYGDIFVYDVGGVNFNYMKKVTPSFLAKILTIYEKVFSIPLKKTLLLNFPPFFDVVLKMVKTIMKPKLFERIVTCPDTSILNDHFSKEEIPSDYGGNGPSMKELQGLVDLKFEQYQNRFDELDELRVDESLRPEKLKNDELLGFYGNFKKLDVD